MSHGPILCVDDEPNNLAVMRQILKDDHKLVFARSGAEALLAATKHLPSLILLDVEMPDINGYDVCRRLKRNKLTEGVPVIFVTGRVEEGDEMAGFDAGGVDYIAKPVSAPIVRARVRTHLSLVRADDLEKSYRAAIAMLGEAGHCNDNDTGMHIWRMASYSRALAEASGWDEEHCILIELAAAMHDTGKIGIPDAILKKPGKLDAVEWDIMKTHARLGYDILARSDAAVFNWRPRSPFAIMRNGTGAAIPWALSAQQYLNPRASSRLPTSSMPSPRSVPTKKPGLSNRRWRPSSRALVLTWTRKWSSAS